MNNVVEENIVPKASSGAERSLLSRPLDAYFCCAPSFREILRASLSQKLLACERHSRPAPIVPDSLCFSGLRYRELLAEIDHALVLENVWIRIFNCRVKSRTQDGQAEEISSKARNFNWEQWFGKSIKCVNVTALAQKSCLRNAAVIRDAVVHAIGERPVDSPQVCPLKVSLYRDTLEFFIPITFEAWHKRGYKLRLNHSASLREDLAQGLLAQLEQFYGRPLPERLYVPFCGSGTFALEFLARKWKLGHSLIGCSNIFKSSLITPKQTLSHLQKVNFESTLHASALSPLQIHIEDIDNNALTSAIDNWSRLSQLLPQNSLNKLHFSQTLSDFFNHQPKDSRSLFPHTSTPLCILLNPPFGKRLQENFSKDMFTRIASQISNLARIRPVMGLIMAPNQQTAKQFSESWKRGSKAVTPSFQSIEFPYGTLDARVVVFSNH